MKVLTRLHKTPTGTDILIQGLNTVIASIVKTPQGYQSFVVFDTYLDSSFKDALSRLHGRMNICPNGYIEVSWINKELSIQLTNTQNTLNLCICYVSQDGNKFITTQPTYVVRNTFLQIQQEVESYLSIKDK